MILGYIEKKEGGRYGQLTSFETVWMPKKRSDLPRPVNKKGILQSTPNSRALQSHRAPPLKKRFHHVSVYESERGSAKIFGAADLPCLTVNLIFKGHLTPERSSCKMALKSIYFPSGASLFDLDFWTTTFHGLKVVLQNQPSPLQMTEATMQLKLMPFFERETRTEMATPPRIFMCFCSYCMEDLKTREGGGYF